MSTAKNKDVKGAPKWAPTSKEGVAPKDPIKEREKAPIIEKVAPKDPIKVPEKAPNLETPGVISIAKPKKEQSENEKKADQLFGVYPGTKEFHFTADGTAFFTPSDARNHAVSLENKDIETIKNQN